MDDVLRVACSCDGEGRYVAHSAAMLHSVLTQRDGLALEIHYLTGPGFPASAAAELTSMAESHGASIMFTEMPDEFVAGLPTTADLPVAAWYRIFLPDLLPNVKKILYLDLDLIAVDSLAPLWRIELGDHLIAAVTNVMMRESMGREEWLGMPKSATYFNSGVMLMNLEQWRRDGSTAAIIEAAHAQPEKMGWAEQDAMNVHLAPRRLPLHPRWNCMNSILLCPWSVEIFGSDLLDEARGRPAIRHFEGPSINKPWHYLCEREMRKVYFEHRRDTPWPEVRLEGRTPRNIVRRVLRDLVGRPVRA